MSYTDDYFKHLKSSKATEEEITIAEMVPGIYNKIGTNNSKSVWKQKLNPDELHASPPLFIIWVEEPGSKNVDGWYWTQNPRPAECTGPGADFNVKGFAYKRYGKPPNGIDCEWIPRKIHVPWNASKPCWGYVIEPAVEYAKRAHQSQLDEIHFLKGESLVKQEDQGPVTQKWVRGKGWMNRCTALAHLVFEDSHEAKPLCDEYMEAPAFRREVEKLTHMLSGLT